MITTFDTFPAREIAHLHATPEELSVDSLKNEPMLYSAGWDFAWENGGPLTQKFLWAIRHQADMDWFLGKIVDGGGQCGPYHLVLDSRVHMLMKGMYPAIPGWHGDAFPRHAQYAQPDLEALNENVKHYTALFGAEDVEVSQTEFLNHDLTVAYNPQNVWKSVNKAVEILEPETWRVKNRVVYQFRQDNLHRAMPCENPGWRLFLRLSIMTSKPRNEIRHQVQVYQPVGEGW